MTCTFYIVKEVLTLDLTELTLFSSSGSGLKVTCGGGVDDDAAAAYCARQLDCGGGGDADTIGRDDGKQAVEALGDKSTIMTNRLKQELENVKIIKIGNLNMCFQK